MTLIPTRGSCALLLTVLLVSGCGGGSSSNRTSGVAAATSSSLPDPGGQVAALSSSAAVQTTPALDAFAAFSAGGSSSDLVIPSDPTLSDRAFVVEDKGTVRIIDLSGASPALDRALPLFSAPLQAGIATGALEVQGPNVGLVTTAGASGEGVALFEPLTAQTSSDVTWFDLNSVTATWPAGTLNSKGVDVGGQALPVTFTSGAVVAAGKLVVTTSNFDSSFDLNPGTALAWDIDLNTRSLSNGLVLQTSDFNPTAVTRLETPQGELLLVTNTGVYFGADASIDVIDPVGFRKVGVIRFPAAAPNPIGKVVVSPDGKRGYLGSQSAAKVYVLDLFDIGLALGNQAVIDLSTRFRGGYDLPSAASSNYVSSLALSHTGDFLYAASFNESALYVIDLTVPGLGARAVGFVRTGNADNFEGLLSKLAVRPGVPGVDFQGPSLFGVTINLAVADRTVTDVTFSLDAVTVDRH